MPTSRLCFDDVSPTILSKNASFYSGAQPEPTLQKKSFLTARDSTTLGPTQAEIEANALRQTLAKHFASDQEFWEQFEQTIMNLSKDHFLGNIPLKKSKTDATSDNGSVVLESQKQKNDLTTLQQIFQDTKEFGYYWKKFKKQKFKEVKGLVRKFKNIKFDGQTELEYGNRIDINKTLKPFILDELERKTDARNDLSDLRLSTARGVINLREKGEGLQRIKKGIFKFS